MRRTHQLHTALAFALTSVLASNVSAGDFATGPFLNANQYYQPFEEKSAKKLGLHFELGHTKLKVIYVEEDDGELSVEGKKDGSYGVAKVPHHTDGSYHASVSVRFDRDNPVNFGTQLAALEADVHDSNPLQYAFVALTPQTNGTLAWVADNLGTRGQQFFPHTGPFRIAIEQTANTRVFQVKPESATDYTTVYSQNFPESTAQNISFGTSNLLRGSTVLFNDLWLEGRVFTPTNQIFVTKTIEAWNLERQAYQKLSETPPDVDAAKDLLRQSHNKLEMTVGELNRADRAGNLAVPKVARRAIRQLQRAMKYDGKAVGYLDAEFIPKAMETIERALVQKMLANFNLHGIPMRKKSLEIFMRAFGFWVVPQ